MGNKGFLLSGGMLLGFALGFLAFYLAFQPAEAVEPSKRVREVWEGSQPIGIKAVRAWVEGPAGGEVEIPAGAKLRWEGRAPGTVTVDPKAPDGIRP